MKMNARELEEHRNFAAEMSKLNQRLKDAMTPAAIGKVVRELEKIASEELKKGRLSNDVVWKVEALVNEKIPALRIYDTTRKSVEEVVDMIIWSIDQVVCR